MNEQDPAVELKKLLAEAKDQITALTKHVEDAKAAVKPDPTAQQAGEGDWDYRNRMLHSRYDEDRAERKQRLRTEQDERPTRGRHQHDPGRTTVATAGNLPDPRLSMPPDEVAQDSGSAPSSGLTGCVIYDIYVEATTTQGRQVAFIYVNGALTEIHDTGIVSLGTWSYSATDFPAPESAWGTVLSTLLLGFEPL